MNFRLDSDIFPVESKNICDIHVQVDTTMELLKRLFLPGRGRAYVDAGRRLTFKLITSLHLPGWTDGVSDYTPAEMKAIKGEMAAFHRAAGDTSTGHFWCREKDIPDIQSGLVAHALNQLDCALWIVTNELPANWKECVSTLLKSWNANRNPETLLRLSQLLGIAGQKDLARATLKVILLFPKHKGRHYAGEPGPEALDIIMGTARQELSKLG